MNEMSENAKWYVVHTYSGHEKKVQANIEKLVENRGMQDQVLEVRVPIEECVEIKDGKKKVKERKKFPGYVIIKMVMNEKTWYLVRNTRGVTGFVGPGSKPVPLTAIEMKNMGIHEVLPEIDLNIGDSVQVVSGPFEDFVGKVESLIPEKRKLKVFISMFGRETLVELDYDQAEKI
ncbi:MAG: transcription termination/antitermination protein NusG [Tissierellales bacterium]|jgi:transcriptional antiterminator NusG|nr:transcription termination/antitermination protein NusG [Tissierellales bacterium]